MEQAAKNDEIIHWYYLTGGTALAEFYLQHRLSEDVDFNEYDYPQIDQGQTYGKLKVDSIYDIAINKLESMCNRTKARDYVDLYLLISQNIFSMEQIMMRVPDKFEHHWTNMQYIRAFFAVQEAIDYPTMLVPFNKEDMIDFYLAQAKKLEPKIFK